jgi:hypothetical protein
MGNYNWLYAGMFIIGGMAVSSWAFAQTPPNQTAAEATLERAWSQNISDAQNSAMSGADQLKDARQLQAAFTSYMVEKNQKITTLTKQVSDLQKENVVLVQKNSQLTNENKSLHKSLAPFPLPVVPEVKK